MLIDGVETMMFHVGWGGEQTTIYKRGTNLPLADVFLSLEGKLERESPKRTISTSGGSGSLQWY